MCLLFFRPRVEYYRTVAEWKCVFSDALHALREMKDLESGTVGTGVVVNGFQAFRKAKIGHGGETVERILANAGDALGDLHCGNAGRVVLPGNVTGGIGDREVVRLSRTADEESPVFIETPAGPGAAAAAVGEQFFGIDLHKSGAEDQLFSAFHRVGLRIHFPAVYGEAFQTVARIGADGEIDERSTQKRKIHAKTAVGRRIDLKGYQFRPAIPSGFSERVVVASDLKRAALLFRSGVDYALQSIAEAKRIVGDRKHTLRQIDELEPGARIERILGKRGQGIGQEDPLKPCTGGEGTFANAFQPGAEGHFRKRGALGKGIFLDLPDPGRDHCALQLFTFVERVWAERSQPCWQICSAQGSTSIERAIPNGGQTVRKPDFRQCAAVFEGLDSDRADSVAKVYGLQTFASDKGFHPDGTDEIRYRHAGEGGTVIEGITSNAGQFFREGHAGQRFAELESTTVDGTQPFRQNGFRQCCAAAEGTC